MAPDPAATDSATPRAGTSDMNTSAREERRPPPRHNCFLAPPASRTSLPGSYLTRWSRAATPLLPAPPPSSSRASRASRPASRRAGALVALSTYLLVVAALVVPSSSAPLTRSLADANPTADPAEAGPGPPTGPFTQLQLYEASWDWMNEPILADAASKWGDVEDWDTSGCDSFENLWSAHRDKEGNRRDWGNTNTQGIPHSGTGRVLEPADLNKWDTSSVTSMRSTFQVAVKFNSDLYV